MKRLLIAVVALVLIALPAEASAAIVRVQNGSTEPNADTFTINALPVFSTTGRYLVVNSSASNFVTGDTNGVIDVFRYDTQTGTFVRVSLTDHGAQATGADSQYGTLTADGRYVAFQSMATNIVPDLTGSTNVFLRDITGSSTAQLDVATDGTQSDGNVGITALFGGTRYAVFDENSADNLVSGGTDASSRTYLRDLQLHTTEIVSKNYLGGINMNDNVVAQSTVSEDARYVYFISNATDVVPTDTNGSQDIFQRDRQASTTVRVSLTSTGAQINGDSFDDAISNDGRYVAFVSTATNVVPGDINVSSDVFLRDTIASSTILISAASDGTKGDDGSDAPGISADGRYVVFHSASTNLVANDTNNFGDVFVHDVAHGTTVRVSVSAGGVEGDALSYGPSISPDGTKISFASFSTNLTADTYTTNQQYVYVTDNPLYTAPPDNTPASTQHHTVQVVSGGDSTNSTGTTPSRMNTVPVATTSPEQGTTPESDHAALVAVIAPYRALLLELKAKGVVLPPLIASLLAEMSPPQSYSRNLSLGSTGDDVYELQLYLTKAATGPAAVSLSGHGLTHYFGAFTQAALAEFQLHVGITPSAGYFGPTTRAYVNAH